MALQLEDDVKEDQSDEHRVRIVLSPSHDRLTSRDQTPPATCPALCGPRSCATLPPTLRSSEPKKRRLWGLRGLVKMFRRRTRRKGMDPSETTHSPIATLRTRSASELAVDQSINRSSSGPYNQGLSVSHDSVFSPESPTEEQHTSTSSLALATRGVNMAELKAALRRRRMDDSGSFDDDPGLPRSPPTSPNAFDISCHGFKNSSRATQSSCSDASMLSMGSSEYDEDSFGSLSHHSSRASLIEGRNYSIDNEPAAGTVTLNHNAARHKMAIRPRRTHAISKMRKQTPMTSSSLPTTIEVNEESMHKSSESVVQEANVIVHSSRENLTPIGEFHAREAVEALVVELVTEKSKSYFSRSVEEKRSSQVASMETNVCRNNLVSAHSSILVEETSSNKLNGIKERNKSDPTSFTKRITVADSSRSTVCSQRSSSLEGLLGEDRSSRNCFSSRVRAKESHPQPRNNLTSIVDVVPVPTATNVHYPPKTISPLRKDSQLDLNVNGEQSCKIILPGPNISDEQTKVLLGSMHNRSSRSSIDNLTTTLLPGIYIRPFSPGKNPDAAEEKMSEFNSTQAELVSASSIVLPSATGNVENEAKNNANTSHVLQEDDKQSMSDCKLPDARRIAREPSFASQVENKTGKVPEFMRVQLNRVKSFNSPVVLNTNEQQSVAPVEKDTPVLCPPPKPTEDHRTSPAKPPRKNKPQELVAELETTTVDVSFVHPVEDIPVTPSVEACPPKEEIVLRRPSLLDKSAVLDQGVAGDGCKKGRSDQPELFKVFARRSFKLKEDNVEDSKSTEDSECKEDTANSVNVTETKPEEIKQQINAVKRFSIGSCPLPFGTRFGDANTVPVKTTTTPVKPNQPSSNVSPPAPKSQRISIENTSKPSLPTVATVSETPVQKPATISAEPEVLSKVAFSRRSFSHVAMKPTAAKSSLGRTSSANQSDFIDTTALIKRANTSNSDKPKEAIRPVVDTKPTITTKPVVWPPAKPCPESPPKSVPIEVVVKPLPAISTSPDAVKVSSDIVNKSESVVREPEGKENQSKVSNRFNGDPTLRKVSLAEAKNSSFAQSMIVESARRDSLGLKTEFVQKPEAGDEPSDDWRVLVRRRREDRLKHTKSMDADEIIMDTRPNGNRSSKVLEMANNFQKLQVA